MKTILSFVIILFFSVVQGFSLPTLLVNGITGVTCFGGSDGSITLSASGGQAPYQFSIDGGSSWVTSNQFTGLSAGTYDAMVIDATGSTDGQNVNVLEPAAYTANITATNISCNGACDGNAAVVVTGGTQTLTTVDVQQNTQGCGAGGTDNQQYWQSFTAVESGYLRSLELKFFNSYGETPTISIRQGNGTGNPIITSASITKASVATCTFHNPVYLNAGQQFTFQISDGSGLRSSCSDVYQSGMCGGGSLTDADLVFSTFLSDFSDPYFYQWDAAGGNGTEAATNNTLCAVTASVTITDALQCVLNKSIVITEPTILAALAGLDQTICEGENVAFNGSGTGGTPGYMYVWDFGDGNTSSQAAPSHTYATAGSYSATLTVTDAHGCNSSDVSVITVNALPVVNVDATANASCFGNCDGSISVSGGVSYQWDANAYNQTTATATSLCANTHTVIATDVNGCMVSESVVITEPTILIALAGGDQTICEGENVVFNGGGSGGTPGYTYLWDFGDGNTSSIATHTHTYGSPGTYSATFIVTDAHGCNSSDVSVITVNALPVVNVDATLNASCNGVCDGGISVSGGSSYQWDANANNQTTATVTNLCANTYTVVAADANGCEQTAAITISEPAALTANSVFTDASCNGVCDGTASVSVSGGTSPYDYTWDSGLGVNSEATDLCAGTVNCTVQDANGCLIVESLVISEPTPITGSITVTDVTCNGDCDGTATILPSGGTLPYSYSWSSGGQLQSESGLCAGSYGLTVVDNAGCVYADNAIINEPTALTFLAIPGAVSCNGFADGTIDFVASGGTPPYSYSIDEGVSFQTTSSYTGLSAGLYEVMVLDVNGCMSSSSIAVSEPSAITFSVITIETTNCVASDGELVLTGLAVASSYDISFTDQLGSQGPLTLNSDSNGVLKIVGLAAGQFTNIMASQNGCSYIDSNTYIINQGVGISINETGVSVTDASCANNDGSLVGFSIVGGTPPMSYDYNQIPNPTVDLLNATPGTYVFTVTDSNGCSASSLSYQILSTVASLNLNVSATDASCFALCDGTLDVSVSGGLAPYSFQWSNGVTGSLATNICSGTYSVTVTDANNCEGISTGTILEPSSIVNTISLTEPSCGLSNGMAEITGTTGGIAPYTYQWSNGNTSTAADSLLAGVYVVNVQDDNGCNVSETVNMTSANAPLITASLTSPSCNGNTDGNIDLTVSGGNSPYSFDWSTGESTEDISNLAAGIYDVILSDASGCTVIEAITLNGSVPIDLSSFTTSDASCGNSDGVIAVSASGGSGNLNYLWSSGGVSSIETGLSPGAYTLSVSDANGCLAMANYTISNVAGPIVSIDQVNQPTCQGATGEILVSVSGGVTPYTYLWSNGSNNEDLLNAQIGEYELTVTDSAGCMGVEYANLIGVNFNATPICMVTVDTATGANIIVWNKEQNLGISEYEIYKETSSFNVFQLLGTVPFDSLSQFVDTAANSGTHSYRYKLRTLDSCSNASDFLAYHKTIHLASNIGLNNVINLSWDDYIGFAYSTFYINRYHPSTGWELIDSVASNVHSYTDNSGLSITGLEYGIEVVPSSPCLAEKAQDHNTTRSNRASILQPNDDTVIDELLAEQFTIMPNPTNGIFTLYFDGLATEKNIEIFDLQGKRLANKLCAKENKTIGFDISEFETGMYLIIISSDKETKALRLIKQ